MKYLFPFLILLTACQYNYPTVSNTSPLSAFPMPPSHQRDVAFFPAGKLPVDTAFVRLIRVEAKIPTAAPDSLALKILKTQAQAEGADALLLEQKKTDKKITTFSGTVIRFKNHLNYVRAYLKWQKVYSVSSKGVKTHALTVAYDFDRYIWKIIPEKLKNADSLFYNFQDRYSPYHLLEEKNNWSYKKDKTGRYISRNYYVDRAKVKKLLLSYPTPETIRVEVFYADFYGYYNADVVVFEQNAQKQIIKSTIQTGEGSILSEYFKYDELGRLSSSTMYQVGEKMETPILVSEYEYFAPEDFF